MDNKIAQNRDAAWKMQHIPPTPNGWIQWKGTDVCMDVYCSCGYHSHIDASFAYYVRCPKCKRVYFMNGHIELIEIKELPDEGVIAEDTDFIDED